MSKDIYPLSSVKEAFTHWRTTRLWQGKIPDYLWEEVRSPLNPNMGVNCDFAEKNIYSLFHHNLQLVPHQHLPQN